MKRFFVIAGVILLVLLFYNLAKPKSEPTTDLSDTSSSPDTIPIGNVVALSMDGAQRVVDGADGAVICPDSKAWDAFDGAWLRSGTRLSIAESFKAFEEGLANPNGCNYVLPGTPLVSEGGTGDGSDMATVTGKLPDGTTIKGITQSNMIYSVPKGNVVVGGNGFGGVICPDSKALAAYQDDPRLPDPNKMSAEEFEAAEKSSMEGLVKSNGCNYIRPGTSLVSAIIQIDERGLAIVAAQMPDGTTIRGVTLPLWINQNQQQPTAANQ